MDLLWNRSLVAVGLGGQVSFSDSRPCCYVRQIKSWQHCLAKARIICWLCRVWSEGYIGRFLTFFIFTNESQSQCLWFVPKLYSLSLFLILLQIIMNNLLSKYFPTKPFWLLVWKVSFRSTPIFAPTKKLDHCWPYSDKIVYYYFIFLLVPVLEKLNEQRKFIFQFCKTTPQVKVIDVERYSELLSSYDTASVISKNLAFVWKMWYNIQVVFIFILNIY